MVSGRADPSLARPRPLAARAAAARARVPARHARRAGFLRRLGALPLLRRREILARLHRRQTLRRRLQGRPQLHRHRAFDRGAVVGPDLCQLERLRSVAVSRRRRTQVVRQHDLEPPQPSGRASEAPSVFRHPAPGMGPGFGPADRLGEKHLHREPAWPGRGPASLQARRLVLSDNGRGRHGLRSRRHHGALARYRRPLCAASRTSIS